MAGTGRINDGKPMYCLIILLLPSQQKKNWRSTSWILRKYQQKEDKSTLKTLYDDWLEHKALYKCYYLY